MVNGNYVLYSDRPPSESEIVYDHVKTSSILRKSKRKLNRNANDLQRTINMANIDKEKDAGYEKKLKEPKLLRYVPNTEVEEIYINDECFDLRLTEQPPRKYAFTKKPKNPADGSVHYAYSHSSSSSPNLPTITEHVEHYELYRPREHTKKTNDISKGYNKMDQYFSKPTKVTCFTSNTYKGSHPDSLYRVPADAAEGVGKLRRTVRMLRWPIALVVVCVALALFVFFLMPDTLGEDGGNVNATYWERDIVAANTLHVDTRDHDKSVKPITKYPNKKKNTEQNLSPSQSTKTTEIDFYDADGGVDKNPDIHLLLQKIKGKINKELPVQPVFPTHVDLEVQYGNEKADSDNPRSPKVLSEGNSIFPIDTTLRPHITQKPEKPLAIYFKDGVIPVHEIITTTPQNSKITISPDAVETTTYERRININEDGKKNSNANTNGNFTSGHSKIFGMSVEDAANYKITTQSSIYNTKVSPTLPTWRDNVGSSTIKYPTAFLESQPQCRSTKLPICRGVLPYDLTMMTSMLPQNIDVNSLMPQIEFVISLNCSERFRELVCTILEPECSSLPNQPKSPCQRLCRAVMDSCSDVLPQDLSSLLDCNKFPINNCADSRPPCYNREIQCRDGTCIPKEWMCDGTIDCPAGEDEAQCNKCKPSEFRCNTGSCIQKRWVCDGYYDCENGEDESDKTCGVIDKISAAIGEPGEEVSGSAPAPAVRKPHKSIVQNKNINAPGSTDFESSKELLMTSDSNNGLRRNYTRRPSLARLTPYSRPILKEVKVKNNADNAKSSETLPPINENKKEDDISEKEMEHAITDLEKEAQKLREEIDKHRQFDVIVTTVTKNTKGPIKQLNKSISELDRIVNGKKSKETNSSAEPPSTSKEPFDYRLSYTAHLSPCAAGELRCVDGRCITVEQLCDGTSDCVDNADEDNCFT